MAGISEAAVSQYKNGRVRVCDEAILRRLADIFGCELPVIGTSTNVFPEMTAGDLVRVPVFDSVSAGLGAYADECAVGYRLSQVPNPLEKERYFYVNVTGVSMQPLIPDKSLVLVHKQDFIDDNSVAVVLIDGCEALVKRVRYTNGHVELISENPQFEPRIFEGDDTSRIRVLGKVVECVTKIS